jgi:serine/threonine protein kinase/WD40 repeat protein
MCAMQQEGLASFLATLRDFQILDARQLATLAEGAGREFPEEPQALAEHLVQLGWLTSWQAEQLLKGEAKNLVLGQYLLQEVLGQGGMGMVFKGRHRRLDRTAAIKFIRKECLTSAEAVQRFYQEARATAQLAHPNIVAVFDADEYNGIHFMAMEYVQGIDLARLVKKEGPLRVGQACDYIVQAAEGLQHAHERKLVHRDIKPSNLIVTRQPGPQGSGLTLEIVKILDMGLARLDAGRLNDADGVPLTQDGIMMGTPDYMAPEQAADAHQVDIRADLYSLGCTFYHLLAGQVPFPGGNLLQKLDRHRSGEPRPLGEVRADTPPPVEQIIRRLMAKRPEDRYLSPGDLVEDLAKLTIPREGTRKIRPTKTHHGLVSHTIEKDVRAEDTADGGGETLARRAFEEPTDSVNDATPTAPAQQLKTSDPRTAPATVDSIAPGSMAAFASRTDPQQGAGPTSLTAVPPPARRSLGTLLGGLVVLAVIAGIAAYLLAPSNASQTSTQLASATPPRTESLPSTRQSTDVKPPTVAKETRPDTPPKPPLKDPPPVIETGIILRIPQTFPIARGTFSVDGCWFLCASDKSQMIHLYDLTRPAVPPRRLEARGPVSSIAVSPKGDYVLFGSNDQSRNPVPTVIGLWNVSAGSEPFIVETTEPAVTALAFSSQGDRVLHGASDGGVTYWERTGDVLKKEAAWPRGHKGAVRVLAFAPDGVMAVSGGRDPFLCVWEVKSGKEQKRYISHENGFVTALNVSAANAQQVLTGDQYGQINQWHRTDWPTQGTQRFAGDFKGSVQALAFTADGKRFLSGTEDHKVCVWDLQTRQIIDCFTDHKASVLAVSSDGEYALSAGADNAVCRRKLPK